MSGRAGKADLSGYNYGAISSLVLNSDRSAIPRRDEEPGKAGLSGYNYGAISSLVLNSHRSAITRRDKEPDGAPGDMGSRVQGQAEDHQEASEKQASKRNTETAGFGYTDIVEVTQDVEGLADDGDSGDMI